MWFWASKITKKVSNNPKSWFLFPEVKKTLLPTAYFLHSRFHFPLTKGLTQSVENEKDELQINKEMARWQVMRAAH